MALTVTPNLTTLTLCDTVTGWLGGEGEFLLDSAVNIQGTGCMSDWVDLKLGLPATYAITSTDMTGEHMYTWLYCSGVVDTKALGGYRLYASSASGTATWYVGGKDTHPAGGWNIFTVSFDAIPDETTGTFDKTAVTGIGVQFKTLTDAPIKGQTRFNNVFWDAIRYGSGLTITSLATDNVGIADIYAIDDDPLNKYGAVTRPAGIDAYVINGKITLGDTGTGSVDFLASGDVMFFPSNDLVSDTFHGFTALGNATGQTNVDINGSTIVSSGVPFAFDFSGANLDAISIIGNSIVNAKAPTFEAVQTITNNTFDGCGLLSPRTSTFEDNVVKNSSELASYALLMPVVHNIARITYSNNFWGFGIDPATNGEAFTEDGGIFSGNTADVYNIDATNAVTVNAVNGSTVSSSATAGGIVTINNAVTISITAVDDSTGLPIQDASVVVKNSITKATIISGRTLASGIYSASINYTVDIDFVGWVRQMDLVGTDYVQKDISGTITTAGASLTVRLLPI